MVINPDYGYPDKMKTIDDLRKECRSIQLEIKQLLLDHYRYDHGLTKQLNVIRTVHTMRSTLAETQREIRERLSV
jgi:hypothetical protein